jgi:OFA family oxalate/formate antiporter-like MFS transporter
MAMTKNPKGLIAVIGSVIAIFWPGALSFGYPGVMGLYWQQTYGVSKIAVGNCLFFVLVALGIFMFIVGKLQERIGTRIMITVGSIICGTAVIIAAFSTNIYMVYLWAFLNGVAASFIYTPILTTVQKWFPEQRGLVSGIVNFSFGISAAIMSPIFSHMLKSQGYFLMNIEIAIMAVIIGVIAARFTEVPERVKFSDGEDNNKTGLAARQTDTSSTVAESIRTKSFWFFWLTWALQGAAGISMVTLSTLFGISKGFSVASAVLVLTSFNLTNGISRLITGYVSDILGRNMTMSIAFFLAGIAYLLLPFTNALGIICILAAVIGFAFGTLFACSAPLASDCFGLKHFGAIFGLLFTGYGFVSGIIGPSLGGYLIDSANGNFSLAFIYLGILSVMSSASIIFVTPIREEMKCPFNYS